MGRKRTASDLPQNIYLRGGTYYVRIHANGRSVWRAAGKSLKAAQLVLGRLREDAECKRLGLPKKTKTTLREFRDEYMKWARVHKKSWPRDERTLDARLIPALGDVALRDLTPQRVGEYIDRRRDEDEITGATANREIALLKKILSYAVERDEIRDHPLRGMRQLPESPARLPSLSEADEAALLAACQPWMATAVRVALLSGLRQGEIIALRWRDVDLSAGALVVRDSKSGEGRRVPMHPSLAALLKPLRAGPDAPVITMPPRKIHRKGVGTVVASGSPEPHTVTQAFGRACARAVERARKAFREAGGEGDPPDLPALDGLRFHDLRHVCATRLLAAGASLPEVASMLGHKTLHIARRYAHVKWDRLSSLVGKMPGAVGADGGPP